MSEFQKATIDSINAALASLKRAQVYASDGGPEWSQFVGLLLMFVEAHRDWLAASWSDE